MPESSMRRRRALPLLALTIALLAGACADDQPDAAGPTTTTSGPAVTTTPTTVPAPTGVEVAQAKESSIEVYATEDAAAPQQEIVSGVDTSVDTIPLVFLVKATGDRRLEVHLPVRPNGSVGWVNKDDVDLSRVHQRIQVALDEHRIRVYEDDALVIDEPVGVGRQEVPTPGGVYYLKELLQPPNPNGVYGTYAYGLSGFSNVLTSFNGGSGVIGIHGTNEPEALGTDVSHGCIRVHNDVIERMVEDLGLPLGTPVEIEA